MKSLSEIKADNSKPHDNYASPEDVRKRKDRKTKLSKGPSDNRG
jgi:hypothetical protein